MKMKKIGPGEGGLRPILYYASPPLLCLEIQMFFLFVFCLVSTRGGSGITCKRGRRPSGGGAPAYDFVKISKKKMHEFEKILVGGGGVIRHCLQSFFVDTNEIFWCSCNVRVRSHLVFFDSVM